MERVDYDIEEAEFHIKGLSSIISVLTSHPRSDINIIRTLAFALQLAVDRRDTLALMKAVNLDA